MNFWLGIFLALLQGATEFLPVSSSGHLALLQIFSKQFEEPPLIFDLFLHLSTLFSIMIYYRKKLKNYLNLKGVYYLFCGTLGTGIVAFPLKNFAKEAFSSPFLISVFLFTTGIILFFANGFKEKSEELNWKKAFIIGLFQGLAIFPGLSRSGVTISTGLFLGLPAGVACEFSFILSMPAILGANIIEFIKNFNPENSLNFMDLLLPFFIAFICGLIFLYFTNKIFIKRHLKPFTIYCIIVSVLIFGAFFYGKSL